MVNPPRKGKWNLSSYDCNGLHGNEMLFMLVSIKGIVGYYFADGATDDERHKLLSFNRPRGGFR
jgi:hypothetical protein